MRPFWSTMTSFSFHSLPMHLSSTTSTSSSQIKAMPAISVKLTTCSSTTHVCHHVLQAVLSMALVQLVFLVRYGMGLPVCSGAREADYGTPLLPLVTAPTTSSGTAIPVFPVPRDKYGTVLKGSVPVLEMRSGMASSVRI